MAVCILYSDFYRWWALLTYQKVVKHAWVLLVFKISSILSNIHRNAALFFVCNFLVLDPSFLLPFCRNV
ncbi:hypothetical protein V8C42DRAFT_36408 [Trichoderma barbatum]